MKLKQNFSIYAVLLLITAGVKVTGETILVAGCGVARAAKGPEM